MFRRDRVRRRGGGVAYSDSPTFELMWIHTKAGLRELIVGALYHPPKQRASGPLGRLYGRYCQSFTRCTYYPSW